MGPFKFARLQYNRYKIIPVDVGDEMVIAVTVTFLCKFPVASSMHTIT